MLTPLLGRQLTPTPAARRPLEKRPTDLTGPILSLVTHISLCCLFGNAALKSLRAISLLLLTPRGRSKSPREHSVAVGHSDTRNHCCGAPCLGRVLVNISHVKGSHRKARLVCSSSYTHQGCSRPWSPVGDYYSSQRCPVPCCLLPQSKLSS